MSFFRYPGGKSKLRKQIAEKINNIAQNNNLEYREPFFGGGSIGLLMLEENPNVKSIWINDFDPGISSLWTTVIQRPDLFKKKVQEFVPSIEMFDKFKEELTSKVPELDSDVKIANFGFKKLAIHQISYSGLGTKSGGPLGGREQKSDYKIDCRWSPDYICKKIDILHERFSKLSIRNNICTNLDFSELINDIQHESIIYLDPPYYDKGNDLYQHGFTIKDHERLADCLRKTNHEFVLSYDDCQEIRKLYSWADIQTIDGVNYSITATKDKDTGKRKSTTKPELLIFKKSANILELHSNKEVQYETDRNRTTRMCEASI
jgi:DNA adenine methylase